MSARLLTFALLTLTLAACDAPDERAYKAAAKTATTAVQRQMGGDTELRWVVRNKVGDEEIVCAYAAPAETPRGERPVVTPVIIRAGKTTRQADVGKQAFDKMQDQLCGPDWVKAR